MGMFEMLKGLSTFLFCFIRTSLCRYVLFKFLHKLKYLIQATVSFTLLLWWRWGKRLLGFLWKLEGLLSKRQGHCRVDGYHVQVHIRFSEHFSLVLIAAGHRIQWASVSSSSSLHRGQVALFVGSIRFT